MPSINLQCDECLNDYTIKYKGKDEPLLCPFCGSDIFIGEEIEPDKDEYDDEDDQWE